MGIFILKGRKEKGISQEKLAHLVEYGRPHISSIESGTLSPSDSVLERIAKVLDVPCERLLALKILDKTPPEIYPWLLAELKERLES